MSRRDAELLLDLAPTGGAQAGLADLLAAAAAPPRPVELTGEEAAVVAFRRVYDAGSGGPAAARPAAVRPAAVPAAAVRTRSRRRRVAVVALSVVAALVGGTAYAAGTSRLPDPVQRRLHEALSGVGVPPPSPDAGPPSAAPGPSSDQVHLTLLCRAWQSTRGTPGAPGIRPDDQRTLAAAAGGPGRIADYCAALTAKPSAPGATAPGTHGNPDPGGPHGTPPGAPPATPPGNGNGNGNGSPGVPADPGPPADPGVPADPGNGNGQNRKGNGPAG